MAISLKNVRAVSSWSDPFIVCGVILAGYGALASSLLSDRMLAVAILSALILVMGLIEWSRGRASRTSAHYPVRASLKHSLTVWAGTLAGLALVLLAWDTLAEYERAYYTPFFDTLPLILGAAPFFSFAFIFWGTRTLGPSTKGDYQLGLIACGRVSEVDWRAALDALIVWLIRGFFLPINFVELVWTLGTIRGHVLSMLGAPWVIGEYYLLIMLYGMIIAAVAPGYLFSSRVLATETRAVSRSWFGWAVTLACYTPFAAAFFSGWFDYNPGSPSPRWLTPWVAHLQAFPFALAVVGGAILLLTLIHLWGEAQFGLRSSNLANRGIITAGAYRFTKHPVYVSKCIGWLLLFLPFASGVNVLDDLRLTVLWFGVCTIYGLRALAEEQLLAGDKDYVTYALWMDEHGLFKKMGALIPPLSFSWRLKYWRAHPLPHQVIAEAA